ncbi:MAG: sporulation protein Cse60 [Anaeroplasmataceae bacterium]
MKVKLFDFEHELDLEEAINDFLENNQIEIIDIKYQISHFYDNKEQLFSYSAMLIYNNIK